jgi:predicted NAD/FAD-binding protein
MISRRKFVKHSMQAAAGSSLLLSALQSCTTPSAYPSNLVGPNAQLGHMLRTGKFDAPSESSSADVVIIGGGVSGLSAARYLKKYTGNFILLELDNDTGGNAMAGSNAISAYPWGAHYLPLPGNNDPELIAFLQKANVITGFENGLPVYNEYHLCFDPKERLYINNFWQEGLTPREGVPEKDRQEIERFLALMHDYKDQRGSDGREAFAIPVDHSSQDKKYRVLDSISMEEFLAQNKFTSPYLRWYVNYCCADDFGSSLADTSAWAGIHYFASRKGKAANASSDTMLTWPEGNYWLVKQLRKDVVSQIKTNTLVYSVETTATGVSVLYFDAATNKTKQITAHAAVLATPQFINQRLLKPSLNRALDYTAFQYAPWMVANITLDATLEERKGEKLCWDNVIYGSDSLGYVNATHQQIGFHGNQNVVTYYKPLLGSDIKKLREQAYRATIEDWKTTTLQDLRRPHKDIEHYIKQFDAWVWGHGMIKPSPGFITGETRLQAAVPVEDKIYFAHSDMSGVSIFEEAFYRGHTAIRRILERDLFKIS